MRNRHYDAIGCSGVDEGLGFLVAERLGVPSPLVAYEKPDSIEAVLSGPLGGSIQPAGDRQM